MYLYRGVRRSHGWGEGIVGSGDLSQKRGEEAEEIRSRVGVDVNGRWG